MDRIHAIGNETGRDVGGVIELALRDALIVHRRVRAGETMFVENQEGRGIEFRLPPLADLQGPRSDTQFDLSLGHIELLRQLALGGGVSLTAAIAGAVATEAELRIQARPGQVFRFGRGGDYSDLVYATSSLGIAAAWAPWDER